LRWKDKGVTALDSDRSSAVGGKKNRVENGKGRLENLKEKGRAAFEAKYFAAVWKNSGTTEWTIESAGPSLE